MFHSCFSCLKQIRSADGFHNCCGVKFDTIMLRCLLYCAQVLWGNRCCCIKPCSYGNHDGSVVVEDCGMFGSVPKSTPSSCLLLSAFARVNSLPSAQMCYDPAVRRSFFDSILSISLSSRSAWHHRGSHTSQDGVWRRRCSPPAFARSL